MVGQPQVLLGLRVKVLLVVLAVVPVQVVMAVEAVVVVPRQ
jgi:hypothetical protein|tara:strand:+ start:748 stop:870 length:123 start_codon:yes stop_codon:yes gene_type:complete